MEFEYRFMGVSVDTTFGSLLESLKVQDPWLPPNTWEFIPFESVLRSSASASSSNSNQPLSSLSESSLVRLVTNAMQGLKTSLITVQQLSAIFCSDPADTTFHHVSSLWNRASTTYSLGNILKSIGCAGFLVFLLREFVQYFTNMNMNVESSFGKTDNSNFCPSLVNQAFAVAVGKVLEAYICGLDTIHASVLFRCSSKDVNLPVSGCLKSVVHSEITLLQFYLHTKELRTQIEALASICNLQKWAFCFSDTSFEDLITEATSEFCNFCRAGDLLTFLYEKLQVADPAHRSLLKFLFLQSCEPYCGFIRSWIFKAEMYDPYKEFIVENMECSPPRSHANAGNSVDFPLASIRVRDGVSVPGFLKDFLVPLVRAGQQLQVLLKLLELCIHVADGDHCSNDFLPCWSGFSCSSLSYSSPLTFSRDIIEAVMFARESYYKRMNEKNESLLSRLEVRYQQVVMHASVPSFDNGRGSLDKVGQLMSQDDSVVRLTAEKNSNMGVDSLGSDVSSTIDELSLLEDMYGSSESSSLNSSEEQSESDLLSGWSCPMAEEKSHLSALSFSKSTTINSSIQNSCHDENSGCDLQRICHKIDTSDHLLKSIHEGMISSHVSNPLNPGESRCLCVFSIQYGESLTNSYLANEHLSKNSHDDYGVDGDKMTEKGMGSARYPMLFPDVIAIGDTLCGEAASEDQPHNNRLASNLYNFQLQKNGHQYNLPSTNPLSMNPMLTRNALLHLMGRDREKCKAYHAQPLPFFDFSNVKDPCKIYMDKLPIDYICRSASSFQLSRSLSTYGNMNNQFGEIGHDRENGLVDVPKHSFDILDHKQDVLALVSGGSSWERLLGSFRKTVNCDATHKQRLLSTFEIPLDIIIDKCLLQEIMLQYKYVSKLAISVLEEAFDLQQHLLTLRRYHYMELADWADLFILSLWHHKWSVREANEGLSEIQGLLELSIQKSSCEQDPNKDRLFVYMKGHGKLPLSTSAIGVRSFDFLGLGYHVDWPLSIVLTPAALKIYADIFSFLIQVKLAIFSLTEVWCSLKDLVHTTKKDLNSELQPEAGHLIILMRIRHQISHFVSTLQQYVESQLSHVSWCRFLHSLQHKVKDMMDLESVHMEYLADSLCICFLSDETKAVGSIIESILQCAIDFRSCLTVGAWDTGSDRDNVVGRLSRINISQVHSIKQKFDRSLKGLHICYTKGPKHGNFGLSRFWEYLNYNEYYSHASNQMGYYSR